MGVQRGVKSHFRQSLLWLNENKGATKKPAPLSIFATNKKIASAARST